MTPDLVSGSSTVVEHSTRDHKIEGSNGTARIRHQCRKTAVLSCHRYLINSGVEKMNNI